MQRGIKIAINIVVNAANAVGNFATTVATTTTTAATTVVPTAPTRRRAVNTVPAQRRARRYFRSAVGKIILILRRRKAWAAEGRALQARWIQDLVEGLERVRGQLVRRAIAPVRNQ